MKFSPVPDGAMIMYLFFGLLMFLVLLLLVTLLEAIVLRASKYGSFGRSLLASLGMNVISTILGYVVVNAWPTLLPGSLGEALHYDSDTIARSLLLGSSGLFPNSRVPGVLLFLLVSWIASVVSEGGVLMLMWQKVELRRIWEIALVANVASYVLLLGVYIVKVWNL